MAVDSYKKSLVIVENRKMFAILYAASKSDLHTSLGYSYQNLSDVQSAIDSYKYAIKENNENPYPYFQLARIYAYQRDKQAAMELYKRLTELDDALSIALLDYIHSLNLR